MANIYSEYLFDFLRKNIDMQKYVRYNINHKERLFATHVRIWGKGTGELYV